MKRKKPVDAEPVVAAQILEQAKRSLNTDKRPRQTMCSVCGGECASLLTNIDDEQLCWVCRRLKISAWRDSDQQMSAQE